MLYTLIRGLCNDISGTKVMLSGITMVKIDHMALVERQLTKIFVVSVVG